MPYDAGLVARVADALPAIGAHGARQKNVFGGRGFLVGRSTFVIVWGEGLLVKTPAAEYAESLAARGVTAFAPGGARPMSTWVVVPADAVAEDPDLAAWVERALRSVR